MKESYIWGRIENQVESYGGLTMDEEPAQNKKEMPTATTGQIVEVLNAIQSLGAGKRRRDNIRSRFATSQTTFNRGIGTSQLLGFVEKKGNEYTPTQEGIAVLNGGKERQEALAQSLAKNEGCSDLLYQLKSTEQGEFDTEQLIGLLVKIRPDVGTDARKRYITAFSSLAKDAGIIEVVKKHPITIKLTDIGKGLSTVPEKIEAPVQSGPTQEIQKTAEATSSVIGTTKTLFPINFNVTIDENTDVEKLAKKVADLTVLIPEKIKDLTKKEETPKEG